MVLVQHLLDFINFDMHIKIESIDTLPLLDKELLYINPWTIAQHNPTLVNNLDKRTRNHVMFNVAVNDRGNSPRFDPDNYICKVATNPKYNIDPTWTNLTVNTFDDITDRRALEIEKRIDDYESVYLFWSGGIDSTVILCSILKTWQPCSIKKLKIALNNFSIAENPAMYDSTVKFMNTVNMDHIFNNKIPFTSTSLYITGHGADPIVDYPSIIQFNRQHPHVFHKPWKEHVDTLIKYFVTNTDAATANFVFQSITESLTKHNIPADTVFDFLWWTSFNWAYNLELYQVLGCYPIAESNIEVQQFLEENHCTFFNTQDYHNWAVTSIGQGLKIQNTIETAKYAFKKYIYNFNKDDMYFKYKMKEESVPKNKHLPPNRKTVYAVDTSYNVYYIYNT